MNQKICCVIGPRDISDDKMDYVTKELRAEIAQAIEEGFTIFLSGFADGVDLLFAEAIVEEKTQHPELSLEAAIPYRNRLSVKDEKLQRLLAACDEVYVQQERYAPNCLLNRNRYMVSRAQRVIAFYDGRERGGAAFSIRYARILDKDVHIIML